jgi:hypothetical protein
MRLGSPGRYDTNVVIPQGVGDEQQALLHHADEHIAFLAIGLAVIQALDGERVLEASRAASKLTPCLA